MKKDKQTTIKAGSYKNRTKKRDERETRIERRMHKTGKNKIKKQRENERRAIKKKKQHKNIKKQTKQTANKYNKERTQ